MAVKETQKNKPIQLNFESVRQVVVTGQDGNDRWVTTVKEAAQACRSALEEQDWKRQFEGFLSQIYEWSKDHADIVSEAFVGISSEGLTGVIITLGPEYRCDFDDEVTKLDILLAKKFPNCRADILQSPANDPDGGIPFISLETSVRVYGNQS